MKQRIIFIVTAALLIVGFAVAAFSYHFAKIEEAQNVAARNQAVLVRAHSPMFGDPAAPVHIVEFFDPACGTCREFYPLVKQLMAAHPGQIKLSLRYAPFHSGSDRVVKAIEAARRQGQLPQTIEALFQRQSEWVQNHTASLEAAWPALQGLGLDLAQLRSDMESADVTQLVQQDLTDAKTLNVTMTPEFFVNGQPLPSFGYEELKRLVDDALAKARG